MLLEQAKQLIDQKVPRILYEDEHHWVETELHGCELCGHHQGFNCTSCLRVVDAVGDRELYQAIESLLNDDY